MVDIGLVLASATGAFAGGGLGATATLVVARLRERGARREEWYRRFQHVSGLVLSAQPREAAAGSALLRVLLEDPLAGPTERKLGLTLYAEVLQVGNLGRLLESSDLDEEDLLASSEDLPPWLHSLVMEDDEDSAEPGGDEQLELGDNSL